MQRIPTLLQKLNELAKNGEQADIIELDLMMDYTRVLYADLLEWRKRLQFNSSLVEDMHVGKPPAIQEEPVQQQEIQNEAPVEETEEPTPAAQPHVEKEELVIEEKIVEKPVFIEKEPRKDADINKLIGINDKYQFMSELFSNNRDAYNQAMDAINGMDSYEEAANWLQFNVSERYNWNKDDETVVTFQDVLKTFFSSR